MLQVLENFMDYSSQKAEKKILSRSGVISILIRCLKSQKNRNISRNIEFHGLWPDIMLDRKRIKSYTIKEKKNGNSLR